MGWTRSPFEKERERERERERQRERERERAERERERKRKRGERERKREKVNQASFLCYVCIRCSASLLSEKWYLIKGS